MCVGMGRGGGSVLACMCVCVGERGGRVGVHHHHALLTTLLGGRSGTGALIGLAANFIIALKRNLGGYNSNNLALSVTEINNNALSDFLGEESCL